MTSLHISKVAVRCRSIEALRRRQEKRQVNGTVPITTRFRPKRAEELVGGSIYWIIKHQIAVRQTILGFESSAADRRTIIRLDADLVPVLAQPRRAHQGWRYLAAEDAPADLDSDLSGLAEMPAAMRLKLAVLALVE